MFNSVGGALPAMAQPRGQASLTDTQKQSLDDLLSKVDSSSLSDDDAKILVSGIKEAGIPSGRALASALSDAGIDARALAEQAGLGGPSGPGEKGGPGGPGGKSGGGPKPTEGGQGSSASDAVMQTMQAILDQLAESSEDEDYTQQLFDAMSEAGLDPTQPTVDLRF